MSALYAENTANNVKKKILSLPGLINYQEIISLKSKLSSLKGKFILHCGECAETFSDFSDNYVLGYIGLFNDIVHIFSNNSKLDLIKIARFAGQFAKPRTNLMECRDGISLPNYMGDIINNYKFTKESRKTNAYRMIEAYAQSAITLNYINNSFYASHDAFLLNYEKALLRQNSCNELYSSSGHFLWFGKKVSTINSLHIDFAAQIINPVGFKVGKDINEQELETIIKKLNPDRQQGKLVIFGRFGTNNVKDCLKIIIKILIKYPEIIYICDPMHGNTYVYQGKKTRSLLDIKQEIYITYKSLQRYNLTLQGISLESTFENVNECISDNNHNINNDCYKTKCDPRLNKQQTLEIIHLINSLINNEI